MITAGAFLIIESSLSSQVDQASSLITKELYSKVEEALALGDKDKAMQEVNTLSLAPLRGKLADMVEYLTSVAMLFGASRVTQGPGTSVVGMGFEALATTQMANTFLTMITQKAEAYIKETARAYIYPAEKVQKENPNHDELGRFASANTPMYRGVGMGASDSGRLTWVTPDRDTAQGYANQRVGGKVLEVSPDLKATFDAGHDARELTPGKFAIQAMAQSKKEKLTDLTDKEMLALHADFVKGQGKDTVKVADLWANEKGKESVAKLLSSLGFDSIHLTEGDKPTYGVLSKVKKAERVLLPFATFMDSAGKAYFDLASSLHTSRVSAYGFTAEAYVLGLEEYQINEQIDNPAICPVCREMHGKTFKVSDARKILQVVTRVTDPDQLKSLQPWPKQTIAAIAELRSMSSEELVSNNWHIPPFHPRCRGLLIRAGKAPSLEAISAGEVHEDYTATKADFSALKVKATAEQVKKWNATVGMAPAEVLARLSNKKVDEFVEGLLTAKNPKEYSGLTTLSIGKNVYIKMENEGFGAVNSFGQGVKVLSDSNSLWLDALDLSDEPDAASVAKNYMREFYSLAKDMEVKKIELVAGMDMGGYAWAKYGFAPDASGWKELKADVALKMTALTHPLTTTQQTACDAILASSDPLMVFALSDSTFGKELLMGTTWVGGLDLSDAESVTRFLTCIGELK